MQVPERKLLVETDVGAEALLTDSEKADLIKQINDIVPGKPATEIRSPGFLARFVGKTASIGARFLIWLDTSVFSMLSWWGPERVVFAQLVFHGAAIAALYTLTKLGYWGVAGTVLGAAFAISLALQFMLYSFEYSLMGKNERKLASFKDSVSDDVKDAASGKIAYLRGNYEITAYHKPPRMLMCAFFWPIVAFFVTIECLAHALLVVRDYALGNRYGSFVLLPEDWVEFYKEVPLTDYTGFVPESLRRRLEQVAQETAGGAFVLVPFGLMPDHLPEIDTVSGVQVRWNAHLDDLRRPQGDPVLSVRLEDQTKYGRMLVVGHWLTLATLQKTNLLFRNFDIDAKRIH